MTIRTRSDSLFPRWLATCLSAALVVILLSPAAAIAQGSVMRVERLQVDHRDPSTIREALLPLLSGRESIGVIGDWLVVAATDGTRNRIREQLEDLDTPIRQLDLTLSFTSADSPDDTADDPAARPATINRELTVVPGQTVRLEVPAGTTAAADEDSSEETSRQISLQVVISGRQIYLEHALHPADEPVDPADGTREALQSDRWQPLGTGIDVRIRPQY